MPPPSETPKDAEAPRAIHVLEITRYSGLRKGGAGVGTCVKSAVFVAGGFDWTIFFYPDGDAPGNEGHVSAQLVLVTTFARVRASFNLGLVDHATGLPAFGPQDVTWLFDTFPTRRSSHASPRRLMRRRDLEASPAAYLRGDTVAVACVVTVLAGKTMRLPRPADGAVVPRREPEPDLPSHIGELLVSQEGADVTFDVDGEAFAAHRVILAARSPVFEAELYGPATMEVETLRVEVHGIRPDVFRALLHFVYTDNLPAMDGMGDDVVRGLVLDLLAAADRYAMERLKVVCEHILARTLRAETVARTVLLADRHHCNELRYACMDLIADSNVMGEDEAESTREERFWAQLQRCDEDKEVMRKACQTIEVLAMQTLPTTDGGLAIGLVLNKRLH